ncbi:FAD-dependent monooxygenase [Streptomyces turgidiscabies]|uniref:FAD binding domain protein n=1 Tax=Streptomyces turgidiscabies (strain Car8) TaxID=698760 RepID=L7F891_STRT8|nr:MULTISPECIES: FAD-dependent monooxygenase [Streptomyces]ELP67818.1 FAD binding domain protein [Streptomyces turgidiscabies Car8]MDX3494272.1 FAD-dependent monooxygenase [Streptomyces turgidiscabies]GAQ68354.1 3-hydroxybenzoate 6-hydroxylase 1 [Streptomyces turgidiscabies]
MVKILVAGGGIGGLAAALSVARHGNRATVLERRSTFSELGAGIQLGPNAFHALDLLGVGEAVRERAVHIDELRFMDGTTGERVASMPLTGAYRARFGNPYAVVHRGDLYQALLDACVREPAVTLTPDASVASYEQGEGNDGSGHGGRRGTDGRYGDDAGPVTAITDTGRRFTGAALIGADGIRSAVRAQLAGDGAPRVSGHTIFRSVIPMERVPEELRWNTVTLWAGPKWHFVHYPIGSGRFLNLAATRDDGATDVVTGRPVERAHVLTAFPELSSTARQLLELGTEWKEWVLCDRDPVERWTDGRVALLGDAAHPMLQYAAQGACMAIEDAVLIGQLLAGAGEDMAARLEKYNAERYERTARTQRVARALGEELYHPAGAAANARNTMLSSLTPDDLYDKVGWLHGARVGAPAAGAARGTGEHR